MRFVRRIHRLFQKDELSEEMESHRAMAEDAQRAQGLSEEEARYAARRLMGNATQAREEARGVWLAAWIESVWQDLRYAVRSLKSQPGFTFMALLALVLGIGLNTSLFTAINAVMFRPWEVPHPSEMVKLRLVDPQFGAGGFPVTGSRFLNEQSHTVTGATLYRSYRVALDQGSSSQAISAVFVSGNYFDVLQVPMVKGRQFRMEEDVTGSPVAVVVLSYRTWMERYDSDPGIVGRTIRVDDVPFTVIGVATQTFEGTGTGPTGLWAPLPALKLARPKDPVVPEWLTNPGWCCSEVAARLAPGVTRGQAQAELTAVYRRYSEGVKRGPQEVLVTGTELLDSKRRQQATPMLVLVLAAVGSILLLACANVSNLLLARAAARQREIAVRVAIGAGRWRVIRQLLTESLLLAAIATGAGMLLAFVLPSAVVRTAGLSVPPTTRLTPDLNVLSYAVGIAVLSAIAFGLAPALRGTRIAVSDSIKRQDGHASPRFPLRGLLLGVQVAISVALLAGAGLLLRGVWHARSMDLGFRTEGVTAVELTLPPNAYDDARRQTFLDDLLARLQGMAGEEGVSVSVLMPLSDSRNSSDFRVPGMPPQQNPSMELQQVSPDYFSLLRMPMVEGRPFRPEDRENVAVIVNESLARHYWPGKSPVGQTVKIGHDSPEIIGVVRDSHVYGLGTVRPTFFKPFIASGHAVGGPVALLVPERVATQAAAMIRRAEARAGVESFPLTDQLDQALGGSRGIARVASGLGLLALLLATVGVYGVISYSVEQRRREIGIRMALGALPGEVAGMVLRRNMRPVLGGLIVGFAVSIAASALLESQLYGLNRFDSVTYAGVLVLMLLAAVMASLIPARRAARTDAVTALHHD